MPFLFKIAQNLKKSQLECFGTKTDTQEYPKSKGFTKNLKPNWLSPVNKMFLFSFNLKNLPFIPSFSHSCNPLKAAAIK